ncbi:CoA-acylating methylmalonate-semialdehyde dehydrogenase [Amycolatopsis nivea]|uniref:CoA-acylating methylmalonate-semialdehyde dehydrogenase n=1 Tax=Amycolatopsis nivea TaxID=1644109 RepID=UPI00106FAC8B|nr:CoA-acylating methylmalonate-semialdehyde dehydrogenase [Amycolatopsis nivea]
MTTAQPAYIDHFVNGKVSTGNSDDRAPVYNPATGEVTGLVAIGTTSDVEEAVAAAAGAFAKWSKTPPHVRARVLFKFRELVERDLDRLAEIITREHGKVFSDAKGELTRGLEVVEFACGIPQQLKGEFTENVGRAIDGVSFRQPLGVVAGISPFNFPAMVPMWMFPVAIACGNTFIMKPSEKDPTLSVELATLLAEAGLPDGVFNVVHGAKTAVDALLDHPEIEAVSFVGSTPVAEYVHRRATGAGKRVQALGGAKNHMVVMPDANLDQTVNALMGAAYGSAGERCMAISVVVPVGERVANALREKLIAALAKLRIGDGLVDGIEMGPLISADHRAKVAGYLDTGVQEGAELVVDGRGFTADDSDGFFIGGSLFDHATPDMTIYREEIFGPVLIMIRTESFSEALELVNAHEFGNGSAIFTRDGNAARHYVSNVKAGMVGVNIPIPVPMAFHSFGGWKRSLFGDHHIHGPEGVRFYTRYKTATTRWPGDVLSTADFAMPTLT